MQATQDTPVLKNRSSFSKKGRKNILSKIREYLITNYEVSCTKEEYGNDRLRATKLINRAVLIREIAIEHQITIQFASEISPSSILLVFPNAAFKKDQFGIQRKSPYILNEARNKIARLLDAERQRPETKTGERKQENTTQEQRKLLEQRLKEFKEKVDQVKAEKLRQEKEKQDRERAEKEREAYIERERKRNQEIAEERKISEALRLQEHQRVKDITKRMEEHKYNQGKWQYTVSEATRILKSEDDSLVKRQLETICRSTGLPNLHDLLDPIDGDHIKGCHTLFSLGLTTSQIASLREGFRRRKTQEGLGPKKKIKKKDQKII